MSEFLEAIRGRLRFVIISAAQREVEQAQHASFESPRAADHRRQGSVEYPDWLKKLIWFLERGTKPVDAAPRLLEMFRPIAEALVRHSELGREVLRVFERD